MGGAFVSKDYYALEVRNGFPLLGKVRRLRDDVGLSAVSRLTEQFVFLVDVGESIPIVQRDRRHPRQFGAN
jgi:hypothetical protein